VAESLAKQKVDAMLLEVTSNKEMSFQRAADIRLMPGNRALPLGVFIPEDFELTEVERIYVGASVVIPHPVQAEGLHEGIDALLMMTHAVRPRVLAIDDDEVLCRFVSSVLEGERIETKTCTNPSLALEKISEFRPDVVLLDVMMPGLTGFEVCRMIREQPELKELPVVFLTSKTSPESRSAAFSVGANDFVTKPVLAPELINRVMNQLNESSLKRQSRTRDPETGVMNGDVIMAQTKLLLEDHLEIGSPMSLALLQMDEYDHLSLVQGQFSARQAAKRFGELIQQRYRSEDLRGRWSDGGYVLVLANCDRDMAASTIQLLQEDFRRFEFPGSAFSFSTTFSAGVADCERDGSKLEDIIKSAHRRMKAAMQTSANSIGFSD
jgi:diguanylate cyclase (GGDEF)-like protein